MIVFDLHCGDGGETFEAWFRSNADYEAQRESGLVRCPYCDSAAVAKAPMAPSVPRKASDALEKIAALQARMLAGSRWVGDEFTDTARTMHVGEIAPAAVHGNATLEQAANLAAEGIPVVPLPLPVVPPAQVN